MRKLCAELVFWLHVAIILFWYSLFFISASWLQDKVLFHFRLSLLIVFHQFLWGLIIMPWTGNYRMVCILTTITQKLRGQNIADRKNYEHSLVKELFGKVGIKIPHRAVTLVTLTIMTVVAIQYFYLQ